MRVQEEYIEKKKREGLAVFNFEDRSYLQSFLRTKLPQIWEERTSFAHAGLFLNSMTGYAIGFAYYDCRPSRLCKRWCYGLKIAGVFDYYMLVLGVLTSEALKTGDSRYLSVLIPRVKRLRWLKIGHWGDAVLEQVPVLAAVARECSSTACWWYTRKIEIATAVNELGLPNLHAYLSLDPSTAYPSVSDYPFGLTYVFGDGLRHPEHDRILADARLTAIFLLKHGGKVQNPDDDRILHHPKLCREKLASLAGPCPRGVCLSCSGRCNYRPEDMPESPQ